MNWKFYIATMVIVIIAGGYMVVNEQSKKLNRLNDANKELASRLKEQVNIKHDYQKRIILLNQLDIEHTKELVNAKKEIDRLRILAEHNPKRVYIRAECSSRITTNSASSMDDAIPSRPTDTALRNYWLLRERITESERMIEGLQRYIQIE
ncbi:lysis protein [Proteus terrae]|uniref:lysis protein n=1 Tax=Proteus terrae TaxID=1574161 RepID=UPI002095E65B|nr:MULTISPECIES: lysis protein [Proteus]MCO7051726.1 lysis protein [Proteus terrae]WFC30114.1 lysis protein [Proteus mirabilis]